MTPACRIAAALALALASAPATGADPPPGYARLEAHELRLAEAGARLSLGNARFCPRVAGDLGLVLHDMAAYSGGETLQRALGLAGPIGVIAVVAGSPAAAAGIVAGHTLIAVDGVALATGWPPQRPDWARLRALRDRLAQDDGTIRLRLVDTQGEAYERTLTPRPACAAMFELTLSTRDWHADEARVVIGEDWPGLAYPEDEFAAGLAHELAHVARGHAALTHGTNRSLRRTRAAEREADRLAVWLLYNAGYPPDAAARFFARWGPAHGGGLLRSRAHDPWQTRAAHARAEAARLAALVAEENWQPGEADWARRFVSEPGL